MKCLSAEYERAREFEYESKATTKTKNTNTAKQQSLKRVLSLRAAAANNDNNLKNRCDNEML